MDNKYKLYLKDLGYLIEDFALEAKDKYQKSEDRDHRVFGEGYLCAFHRIISLMLQQAEDFDISKEELGMSKIDINKDLI